MYSVVLMAALTTGTAAPDCHWKGGCYGGGCYGGGYGGCYGCYGGGYGGCYGGCYGGGYGGCYGGCYGGGYGGCYGGGCYGGWGGCYGGCYGGHGVPVMPAAPPMGEPVPPPKKNGTSSAATNAKLVVELPEDARLYIDDQLMKTPAARRVFNTPTLDAGQAYYYIVRAEVVRDGKTHSETKRVVIRAGEEIRTAFPELETAALAARAATNAGR